MSYQVIFPLGLNSHCSGSESAGVSCSAVEIFINYVEGENSQNHLMDGASYQTGAASDAEDNLHCFTRSQYFNARSLIHKHDELCAVAGADNSDVVCIVQPWLST